MEDVVPPLPPPPPPPPPTGIPRVRSLLLINRTTDFSTTSYEMDNFAQMPSSIPPDVTDLPKVTTSTDTTTTTTTIPPTAVAPAPIISSFSSVTFRLKLSVLLSRSSGRDKLAAFMQYFAMFVVHQHWFTVSFPKSWLNLEESMSTGRKTLRLFKWLKEFERMERAFWFTDPGPHSTVFTRNVASVLGLVMHTFSFWYYVVDNLLYASQTGLLLSANPKRLENHLKDYKNYSSLGRLLIAIVYCGLQIDSATKAQQKNTQKKQVEDLEDLKVENWKEIFASVCNLGILLNRLQVRYFAHIPLWGVGVLGVLSAIQGLEKNWPVESKD